MLRGDRSLMLRLRRSGFMGGERGDRWLMWEIVHIQGLPKVRCVF
ncbi:hypothetical protein APA_1559 [Pseudanabaena sp. lw0831]|nr:hypothetical protein APA_1559 [Pseudanabaena sp. lw0831]